MTVRKASAEFEAVGVADVEARIREGVTDVLPRLARRIRIADVGALMPARWKARRLAAAPTPDLPVASDAAQSTDAI